VASAFLRLPDEGGQCSVNISADRRWRGCVYAGSEQWVHEANSIALDLQNAGCDGGLEA
jgi:hypothetical protein